MKIAAGLAADALNVELLHEQLFYEDGSNVGWGNDPEGLGLCAVVGGLGYCVSREARSGDDAPL